MIKKYIKKPVVVEAIEFTGGNTEEVLQFVFQASFVAYSSGGEITHIDINTLEGTMRASIGDYIIKGVKGEFYPCKPDIFHATYKEMEEGE